MDNKALAEQMTDLYADIERHYEKKTSGKPTAEQTNTIFIETCKRIISDLIGKERKGVPSQQKDSDVEIPTDRQIAFAGKLGCKNPTFYSKKDLSKWIEENKTY